MGEKMKKSSAVWVVMLIVLSSFFGIMILVGTLNAKASSTALPDLVVTSITPTTATADESTTFSIVIKNQGTADVDEVFFADVYVDGYYDTFVTINSLAAGNSVTKTVYETFYSLGSHTIKVIVDNDGYIEESNENNNEKTITVTVSSAYGATSEYHELHVTLRMDGTEHNYIKTTEPEYWKVGTFWSSGDAYNKQESQEGTFTILQYDLDDMALYKKGAATNIYSKGTGDDKVWYYSDHFDATVDLYILELPPDAEWISSTPTPDSSSGKTYTWYNINGQDTCFKSKWGPTGGVADYTCLIIVIVVIAILIAAGLAYKSTRGKREGVPLPPTYPPAYPPAQPPYAPPTYPQPVSNRCPNCNASVESGWSACPYCGADLLITVAPPRNCPNCGNNVEEGWSACPYCGRDIT